MAVSHSNVNTGFILQEPLTPVPSHRGPGVAGAGAARPEPERREAGERGAGGPTPVHTVTQVSDQ